eukprot:m.265593 g.265593  ORF g.265593 m.265593 type:complete len:60 (+) comp62008_c0_seq1:36-215(+)
MFLSVWIVSSDNLKQPVCGYECVLSLCVFSLLAFLHSLSLYFSVFGSLYSSLSFFSPSF